MTPARPDEPGTPPADGAARHPRRGRRRGPRRVLRRSARPARAAGGRDRARRTGARAGRAAARRRVRRPPGLDARAVRPPDRPRDPASRGSRAGPSSSCGCRAWPPRAGARCAHPAHDHLSLADIDTAPGLRAGALLDAIDATLVAAGAEVGAVPAWRASPVPEDSALVRAVRGRTGAPDGPVDAARWTLSPARDTARFDIADGAFALPGKLARNLRRLRARLHEGANAEAVVRLHGRDDGEALEAAFERFVALEASGWKAGDAGTPGTAIAADPGAPGVLTARCCARARRGSSRRSSSSRSTAARSPRSSGCAPARRCTCSRSPTTSRWPRARRDPCCSSPCSSASRRRASPGCRS